MKILLLGSAGQVGSALMECNHRQFSHDIIALSRDECNIQDKSCLETQILTHKPDWVINTAAYTAVDKAETDQSSAFAVNTSGVNNIASLCAKQEIPVLHYSTDYVFQGNQESAYTEEDIPAPCNYYGKTKWLGEQALMKDLKHYFILRVSGVFKLNHINFISTIVKAALQQKVLKVVSDQYASPTSARSIALASLSMLASDFPVWGIYHYTGQPPLSWYDFACYCIEVARQYTSLAVEEIIPVSTAEYRAKASRPLRAILDCTKIKTQFGLEQPDWKEEVSIMIKALLQ
ncbi:MAG: rmlD 2 [Gammaproteobacteria bacterium]|nr:rmlD 2 [Gammaproteobacteria bacterium]